MDARRRRRQELARGWKFACECSKCAADALVQAEGPDAQSASKSDDNDFGVPLEKARLEEAVARVEAELARAAVSKHEVPPAPESTPHDADDERAFEPTRQPIA